MGECRSKEASVTCNRRKKRCSDGLPCEYCTRIGKLLDCEYRTKVPSKTVRVTERYFINLKR
ncbi:LAFE_0D12970g1_1 [Lachancea fermentati]|uniref:LAFE_0D12970g1_1 n=1 Tax=Lachancea fermentati TaxID=4955 RepID=A0A1G4MC87_LACFM|nr:LAFE_0D12970g1_1 [Lachancea fermentati]